MSWEFQVITLIARRYPPGASYLGRDKFTAVATVQLLDGKRAHLSGFLADGVETAISRKEWVALGMGLYQQFGISLIDSERHGIAKTYDSGPAPL